MTPEEMLVAGIDSWVQSHPFTITLIVFYVVLNSKDLTVLTMVILIFLGIHYGW